MAKKPQFFRNYLYLSLFGVAMGILEAIIVVYIRELYYPEGFNFPLKVCPSTLITWEWIREITTMIMLACLAWLAGRTKLQRFSFFLFTMGIWDIFYYIGLKLFLNWPESFLTWDVLFLIPITWIGPVLAPLICSLGMILISWFYEHFQNRGKLKTLTATELLLILGGALVIIVAFTWDFAVIIIEGRFLDRFFSLPIAPEFQEVVGQYIPTHFHWDFFSAGFLLILTSISITFRRITKEK